MNILKAIFIFLVFTCILFEEVLIIPIKDFFSLINKEKNLLKGE